MMDNELMGGYTDDNSANRDNQIVSDLTDNIIDDLNNILDTNNYQDFKVDYDDINNQLVNASYFHYTYYTFALDDTLKRALNDLLSVYVDLQSVLDDVDKKDDINDLKHDKAVIKKYATSQNPNLILEL